MDLRKRDGIVINTNKYSEDGRNDDISIFLRGLQLLAIILGSWSFLYIYIESFSIQAQHTQAYILLMISSIIFFLFFLYPSYGMVKAFFSILFYVLFCYSRFPRLQNAFYILENAVILKLNQYYETQILFYIADYTTAEADMSLLLGVIVIPITALLAAAIIQKRMRGLAYFLLMSPIIASFLIGVVPAQHHFIIILLVLIFLSKVHGNAFAGEGRFPLQLRTKVGMKVAILLCGICLILFFTLKLLVSPAEYESIHEIKTMKSKIQTAMFDFSIEDVSESFSKFKISNTKAAAGGLSGGQLGAVDQVSFTNTEHLRITVPFPSAYEGLYLKGYVGSVYTGDHWEEGSKDAGMKYRTLLEKLPLKEFSPVNQVGILLERLALSNETAFNNHTDNTYRFSEGNISITYKDANKNYLYAPYFTNLNSMEAIEYKQDLYAIPTVKKDKYELNYYFDITFDNGSSNLIDANFSEMFVDYQEYEKLYREFVYDVYTQLPEVGLERLKKDFAKESIGRDLTSISEKIRYVKEYLHRNTEYSLSPGKLPKGKDFVEYFLYENPIGYCAHYASAATLMLRAMGVPARYVEGYSVSQNEIIQSNSLKEQLITEYSNGTDASYVVRQLELSVKDYNAHAWVEVYIDHCGWIPVEFTPGSAWGYTDTMVSSMTQIGEEINQHEEQNTPTVTPIMPSPTPIEQTDEEQERKPTTSPDFVNTNEKGEPDEEISAKGDTNWALIVIISIILGVGIIAMITPIMLKKNRIRRSNHNQKALLLYREIEKIISFHHGFLRRNELLEDHLDYVRKNHPYLNGQEFTDCMEIVQRARFGRDSISGKDLKKVLRFYEDLFEKTYENASFSKKLYLMLQLLF